jgi:hypothetical protein
MKSYLTFLISSTQHQEGIKQMETLESKRFFAYVARTSRSHAIPRREAVFSVLDGRDCTSITELCARVGGNSKMRTWLGQAMRDGEIVRVDGKLRLPNPTADEGATDAERLYARADLAAWDWVRGLPEGSEERERARRIAMQMDVFFEADLDTDEETDQDEEEEPVAKKRKKNRPARAPFLGVLKGTT